MAQKKNIYPGKLLIQPLQNGSSFNLILPGFFCLFVWSPVGGRKEGGGAEVVTASKS